MGTKEHESSIHNRRGTMEDLIKEVARLRARLEEAEDTLRSIRDDEVDALVISGAGGEQVFTLQTSERPYRLLIERMQEGALTLTSEGIILYSNQGFADILGQPLIHLIGASLYNFVAPDSVSLLDSILRESCLGSSKGEIHLKLGDGAIIPVYISATVLPEDKTHPIGLIITDLREQKRNEQVVKDEKLARAVLEYAAVPIVVCNTDGFITRANQAAHELAGKNVLQRPFMDVFPLDIDLLPLVARAMGTGLETCLRRSDKRRVDLIVNAGPLRGQRNTLIGYVVALTDITQRKKDEVVLREKQHDIETLNVQLQRSMSETHHRVKNNLQIITALVNMQLLEHREAVPVSELIRLNQHIQALATIHDLLTLQAKKNATVTEVSIREVMDKFLPSLQTVLTDDRSLKITVADISLSARQATTFAVIVNELISNAIKHGEGEIGVTLTVDNDRAHLEVTDQGPGFPTPFDPEEAANTGLELLQSLARWDLQGTTRFENGSQGGACVIVEFPLSVPAVLAD